MKEKVEEAQGRGPDGLCVCLKCRYNQEHKKGIPCSKSKCPKCGGNLERR